MISCDKAAILCNKAQYEEASDAEIAKLKAHLEVCELCSTYTDKNTNLTMLCRQARLHSLSEADKMEMKKRLDSEMR